MLSLRRPGVSLLLKYFNAWFPGGVWVGLEAADWEWTPGGSLTVSGMTGLRRCSGCLKEVLEDSEVEEAQLYREEEELAWVRFGRETRPPGTLGRWARSGGLGGQTGLNLLSWVPPLPGRERGQRKRWGRGRYLPKSFLLNSHTNSERVKTNGRSCNHVFYQEVRLVRHNYAYIWFDTWTVYKEGQSDSSPTVKQNILTAPSGWPMAVIPRN